MPSRLIQDTKRSRLLGFGQLIDLVLIPGMITNANLRFVAFGGARQNVNQHQNVVVNVVAPSGTGRASYMPGRSDDIQVAQTLAGPLVTPDVTAVARATLFLRVERCSRGGRAGY